jgi:hypothetical protein
MTITELLFLIEKRVHYIRFETGCDDSLSTHGEAFLFQLFQLASLYSTFCATLFVNLWHHSKDRLTQPFSDHGSG